MRFIVPQIVLHDATLAMLAGIALVFMAAALSGVRLAVSPLWPRSNALCRRTAHLLTDVGGVLLVGGLAILIVWGYTSTPLP